MFTALPAELQDGIKAMAADSEQRANLATMLAPFGLTLAEIDEVLGGE